ncbi:MAG TPA: aminodeoxychorismate/anthranilate synthase component II [Planctomycetaceae bacterium]|nr:aminodeoxychorismate/anthranilate synthase component II [Planctomycetaceae bacterium]
MILVIDNHDSFVHNLARYIRLAGMETVVIRCDRIDATEVRRMAPLGILLSPGPKRPQDAGCCIDVIRTLGPSIPILGVCLGHQAIGHALGGDVIKVAPVHGRSSLIAHDGQSVFQGCPNPMRVARYHSLAIAPQSLPEDLIVTATTIADSQQTAGCASPIVMAIRHRVWPLMGVQFHPESVLTTEGFRIIANFVTLAKSFASTQGGCDVCRPSDQSQLVP